MDKDQIRALYDTLAKKVTAGVWSHDTYNQGLWDMMQAVIKNAAPQGGGSQSADESTERGKGHTCVPPSEPPISTVPAVAACTPSATPRAEKEDPGTVKILTALVERAYGIFTASGVLRVAEQDPDSNDPIVAWASDVRSILYRNKPAWTTNG